MNVTQTTVYNYQIETVGSDCLPEIVLNGSITLEPEDLISLITTPALPVVSGIASRRCVIWIVTIQIMQLPLN